jgi:hypothetical protein
LIQNKLEIKIIFKANFTAIASCSNYFKAEEIMKNQFILILFLIFVGCVSQHEKTIPKQVEDITSMNLPYNQSDKFGVMLSRDGKYETIDYPNSGMNVSLRIKKDLHEIFKDVVLVETINRKKAIDDSKKQDLKYLIIPQILHWEDRATNWSGKPDIIKIQLSLYDVNFDKIIESVLFHAESSWWTLVNTPPEEMLDQSFDQAVLDLLKVK